ncbi:hypothetical protein A1I_04150 [Rickettsia bellii OSU 85-389]|uniref:hypothetical protein n=1 Tax=Rickettsia bellii TaxID=33990 RepID=UPI0000DB0F24|nr:hypothetical protein [Rickettsia bellii]ABV79180.1 hypothetical protein A1I_04150 [Rickettsia bellii OSU 85-389]
MKLQIRFFANLYNFLIEDYPLQPNKENIIKLSKSLFKNSAEVNFLLQNIHILDLPYCEPNRVEAIKDILKLYILKSDKLNINIPKFKYKIRYDKFLKQHVTEKILQPPIKELDTSYVLFRNYSPQELTILREKGNNLLFFNSKLCEVIKLLNFINQFFVVDHSKVSYCILDIASRFYDEEDLKIFLDSEIDIELNYIGIITNHECKNLDSFINSKQVAYNRFLILYHEAFKSFDKKELTILFKACSNNNNLVKSLILCPNSLTLEQCIKNIENYIELHQTLIKAPICLKKYTNEKITLEILSIS